MNDTAEIEFPPIDAAPPSPQTAVATAAAQAMDLEKMDLRAIALSAYQPSRELAAEAKNTLTGVVHDLTTQAKVDAAKSLRQRLINAPMADVRKLTKGIKSKLAAVSKTVGEEEEKVLAAFTAADALITPQIEAREAELEAERQARAQAEADRKATHEANLARLTGAAQRARDTGADSAKIADGIAALEAFPVTEAWEEYRERGEAARLKAIEDLRALHDEVKGREDLAAENERLRLQAEAQAAELAELRAKEARSQANQRYLSAYEAAVARFGIVAVNEAMAGMGGEPGRLTVDELNQHAARLEALELTEPNAHEGSVPADAPAVCASSEPEASNGSPSGDEGPAAQGVLRAADPAELWAVHVAGPDDIEAAASREDAEARAEELNAWSAHKRIADTGMVFLATVVAWPYSAEGHATDLRLCGRAPRTYSEYTEGQHPQQVLKAEPATADATDRGTAADASPGGGPMGVGQPAAAGPAGGPRIIFAEPEPADPLDDAREFVALVLTAFNTKFPTQPKPSVEWWAQVRQAGEALQARLA